MYIFGLLLGHEPRLVDRRRRDGGDYGKDDVNTAASTLCADESAGDTGSFITADTPIDQIPVVHLSHGGGGSANGGRRVGRRRSRSQAPRRDRLSLWSRLMCQPEVFDPHVEAAPMSYLMEMGNTVVSSPLAEHHPRHHQQQPLRSAVVPAADDIAIVYSAAASSGVQTEHESHRGASARSGGCAPGAAATETRTASLTRESSASSPATSSSSSSSDSLSQDPNSPVSSVEEFLVDVVEVGAEEPLDEEPPALSVSVTGGDNETDAPLPKPRRAFRVTDTRKCRCRLSRANLLLSDTPASTTNTSFATSSAVDSNSSGVDTFGQSATTSTTATTAHPATNLVRLISREELAMKRVQRRQQTKEAAHRLREYNAAWAALIDSQQARTSGRLARLSGAANLRGGAAAAATATGSDVSGSVDDRDGGGSALRVVVTATLTNDALESHRERIEAPSYELPDDLLVRMCQLKGSGIPATPVTPTAATAHTTPLVDQQPPSLSLSANESMVQHKENDVERLSLSGGSLTSGDSGGVGVVDDCLVSASVEGVLPVMYSTMLRCSEAADRDSSASAAANRVGTPDHINSSISGVRTEGECVQRIPRGRYALGSRGYVEHVMFAQCRQQECALFSLLTEAHRQARAAHLRLSQVYYYYLLPVLAQHQQPEEVEGLVASLLQCGSGSLRAFHADFCHTVKVDSVYDAMSGASVPANLLQVQPVDYQLAQYRFENPWRELFHEIKTFLGMQAREDVSVETLSTYSFTEDRMEGDVDGQGRPATMLPSRGTVCMAATVLHSMEIFERQRHTQMATRDAEDWLAWYYYFLTPQLQHASTSVESRLAAVRHLLPVPSAKTSTAAGGEDASSADAAAHPLEKEYLPMVWGRACETARREAVLSHRRALKLEVMTRATMALQTYVQAKKPDAVCKPAEAFVPCATESSGVNLCEASAVAAAATIVKGRDADKESEMSTDAITCEYESCVELSADTTMLNSTTTLVAAAAVPTASVPSPLPPLFAEDYAPSWLIASPHTSPTMARMETYSSRVRGSFVADPFDAAAEDDEEEEIIAVDAYQTVNVGCFGLSFFSFFD